MSDYEVVIGLEVHVELSTNTKIFCGCATAFGAEANSQCCPICLGIPGSLPVMNAKVVEYALKAGLALNCTINQQCFMDRKNYHYPDMTKNFQVSQRNVPLCVKGQVDLLDEEDVPFCVGITQIHMEEDAGKLVHLPGKPYSRADYNRGCVPLIEIVTEPDMRNANQVRVFLQTLRETLLCLGISDCRMEEGSMRCDVNISVRKPGGPLGVRAEIKNVNSMRSIGRAIEYESGRQIAALEKGEPLYQQTLRWDDATGRTSAMREKENSHDYRYFPEPDLPPIVVSDEQLEAIRNAMPELPFPRRQRYIAAGLPKADAWLIAITPWMSALLEEVLKAGGDAKTAANTLTGPLAALWNEPAAAGETLRFAPREFVVFVALLHGNKINSSAAKTLLEALVLHGGEVEAIVRERNLAQMDDAAALREVAAQVVADNPAAVKDYLAGKEKALTSLQGAAMKLTKGKANPMMIKALILELIEAQR